MSGIDYGILILFVLYAVFSGLRYRKRAGVNLEEYFLAGRTLSGTQAGISMAATQFAADTPLLVTGLVASGGLFSVWRLWVYGISFLALGFIFSGMWRRAGVLTDLEVMELRYSGQLSIILRAIKAVHLGTLVNCSVLAMVLLAATRVSEAFFFWDQWLPATWYQLILSFSYQLGFGNGPSNISSTPFAHDPAHILAINNLITISLIVVFTWFYSATGGLRSVVKTDVAQFTIMIIGMILYAYYIFAALPDNEGSLFDRLSLQYGISQAETFTTFWPSWDEVGGVLFVVFVVQWIAHTNADGTGYLAQRVMACRNEKEARRACLIFSFLQIVIRSIIWVPITLGLLLVYPFEPDQIILDNQFTASREASFITGISQVLPIGVLGLLVTSLIAALASTVDSHLNWGASYWTNDLYSRFLNEYILKRKPGVKELVFVARLSNFIILCIAGVIAFSMGSIQNAWHISLLFGSGLGLVIMLRWLWYRINIYSELAASVSSLLLAPVLFFLCPELSEGQKLLILFSISSIMVIVVTLCTKPEPMSHLEKFYQIVKPQGFWGPVEEQLGYETRKSKLLFLKSLCGISLGSIILYSLLAIGSSLAVSISF